MEAREVIGGIGALIAVCAVIGVRWQRAEMRAERRAQVETQRDENREGAKDRMLHLMSQAPDQKRVGEYLVWGVNIFHDEVVESLPYFDGVEYRDGIINRIFSHAQSSGREDIQRCLEKLRTYVQLSDQETWWELKPQYVGK